MEALSPGRFYSLRGDQATVFCRDGIGGKPRLSLQKNVQQCRDGFCHIDLLRRRCYECIEPTQRPPSRSVPDVGQS
jgi:hypothetical protein